MDVCKIITVACVAIGAAVAVAQYWRQSGHPPEEAMSQAWTLVILVCLVIALIVVLAGPC